MYVGGMMLLLSGTTIFGIKRAKKRIAQIKATGIRQGEFQGDVIKALEEQAKAARIRALKHRPKVGAILAGFLILIGISSELQTWLFHHEVFESTLPLFALFLIPAIGFLVWGFLGPRKARQFESATVPDPTS